MAKKLKFKPTPAGILFLSAIGVLLIAIIILTVIAVRSCGNKTPDPDKTVVASQEPVDTPEPVESVEPSETPAAVNPGSVSSSVPSKSKSTAFGRSTIQPWSEPGCSNECNGPAG